MFKLCVFDLDGTLVDTISDIAISLNYGLTACGFPPLSERETAALVGHSVVYMCKNATPPARADAWEEVYAAFMTHYAQHLCDHSRPYEGVLQVLETLRRAGVTLAVATNKPHAHARRMLSALFPPNLFSLVLGRMDRFTIKPAPDALRFVIDYFDAADAETVYIGDSEVDIAFAKNTGVPCISVSWGLRTRAQLIEAGATAIADDPAALLALMNK